MPKYSVLLEGRNFPLKLNSETQLYGFYTTRRVKADNSASDFISVNANSSACFALTSIIDKNFNSEPMIYCEGIRKIGWWPRLKMAGYTFYKMNSE